MMSRVNKAVWFLLFILASSLWTLPNLGGSGVYSPFNMSVYIGIVLFVMMSLIRAVFSKKLIFSQLHLYLFVFLAVIFASTLVVSIPEERYLLSYGLAFLAVFFFSLSVKQFRFSRLDFQVLLFGVMLFAVLQLIIIWLQRYDSYRVVHYWTGYFPLQFSQESLGSLQQVNMMQTYLAFATGASLVWLASLKQYKLKSWQLVLLFIFVLTISWEIATSNSRAGLLGLIISSVLLILVLHKQIKINKVGFILWSAGLIAGILIGLFYSDGRLMNQVERVYSGSDFRLFLYLASIEMFWESLWFGYGLEGFRQAFIDYALSSADKVPDGVSFEFIKQHSHPHNELLYWALQGGVIALTSIVGFVFWWFKMMLKRRSQRFWLVFALSFPLLLQSQVSYPFILSALHLFTLVFVLFVFDSSKSWVIRLPDTPVLKGGALLVSLIVFFSAVSLAWSTQHSAYETYYYAMRYELYERFPEDERHYFKEASENIFFKKYVNKEMVSMLHKAMVQQNDYDITKYLDWVDRIDIASGRERAVFYWISVLFYLERYDQAFEVYENGYKKYYANSQYIEPFEQIFDRVVKK